MRSFRFYFIILLILGLFNFCVPEEQNGTVRPNFVIFYSDELSPGYLGCYGGDYQTPYLDKLAREGLQFTRAYTTASMCTPARFSLLTGRYPGRCDAPSFNEEFPDTTYYSIAWNTNLTSQTNTIPRALRSGGYYTGMIGKWHLSERVNLGFPSFDNTDSVGLAQTDAKLSRRQNLVADIIKGDGGFDFAQGVLWANYEQTPLSSLQLHNFEWMSSKIPVFLQEAKRSKKPFFLYFASTAIHGPTHQRSLKTDARITPEGWREELGKYNSRRDSMLQEIRHLPSYQQHRISGMWFLDNQLGKLIADLKNANAYDNTVIIFMADHNVEPGKATCYEKGIHVPMIVHYPKRFSKGEIRDQVVQNTDLFPTIASMANIEIPSVDGNSLMDVLKANKKQKSYIYAEAGYTRAISDGDYKYIAFRYPEHILDEMKSEKIDVAPNYLDRPSNGQSRIALSLYPNYFDQDQLYDLRLDPYELNNLASDPEYEEILARLRSALKGKLATFDHPFSLKPQPFLQTTEYKKMTERARARGFDDVYWVKSDHGTIEWPPKQSN